MNVVNLSDTNAESAVPNVVKKTNGGNVQPGMQALTRGLHILDLTANAEKPLKYTDLLELSGLPKGTLHRILQTLVDERFMQFDERNLTYRLGSRPFELAHRVWDQFDLRGAAEPELERLRDLTRETVRLGILDNDTVLFIDQREMPQPVRVANGVGSRAAVHAAAIGKAILSHMNLADRQIIISNEKFEMFTDHTIQASGDLNQQLNIIKARGYALSVEELHEGVNAVAAPILDHRAEPLGAIGVVGPAFRLKVEQLHSLGREVMEAARRISGNIGELAMSISVNPRPLGVVRDDVKCVIPGSDFLAEGPHWSANTGKLYWVDILAPAIIEGDPKTGERESFAMPELVGVTVPKKSGGFLAATETGIKAVEAQGTVISTLANPESDKPGNRFNDGKCDPKGRFWAGTLAINTSPSQGALWRYDSDGVVTKMDDGFTVSNGLGWSPEHRLFYFTDSGKRTIYVYDYDLESGDIENRRTFAEVPKENGSPDGLTVDSEGFIWSAHWDGWCVTRYDPGGKVERVINLPIPRPTSCIFGGDDLSTLFVTTARIRLSAQQLKEAPLSGGIFAVDTGVKGLPEFIFAG